MEASVWGGRLKAYEGNRPVYVTLIAPRRGGTPVEGKDPIETASTPTGQFPVSGKFATATMEAPGEFIHSDVPWTQNFSGPHALHGAYWHDDWGNLKSGGCVNVSPIDGKWLYEFTEPEVPKGWHGVRWLPHKGPATQFVVHR
jgi:lipoprotein-anchoring transpeptidase ErfK/SrfK